MRKLIGFILMAFLLNACYISTKVMHDPIYPASNESVSYSITAVSNKGIKAIKLYETISSINSSGNITAGTESLLDSWTFDGSSNSESVSFTKTSGYSDNRIIEYRIWVRVKNSYAQNRTITYAVRPYPVADHPAPVYAQGDVDDVFDIIFVPDTDITNMNVFRQNCGNMIENSIYREPTMKIFCKQFNFYINPETGTATDYNRIATDGYHQRPSNNANLSFAEVQVLMHQNNLRDYSLGDIFSTEMDRPQTLVHEGGHALFNLADEYPGGGHWEEAVLPNNWKTLSGAQTDAPRRGKTSSDAVEMGTSGWFKICHDDCPMISGSRLLFDFDIPCEGRVTYEILLNATD